MPVVFVANKRCFTSVKQAAFLKSGPRGRQESGMGKFALRSFAGCKPLSRVGK